MASWGYRVLFDGTYRIGEVYYDDAGEILGYTGPECNPVREWETLDWLHNTVDEIVSAFYLPVIDVRGGTPLVWTEVSQPEV